MVAPLTIRRIATAPARVLGVKILLFGALLLLGLSVLFVAPFLHGSARNRSYQAGVAANSGANSAGAAKHLPKLGPQAAHASTWIWGTAETVLVIAMMIVGYRISEHFARRRIAAVTAAGAADAATATTTTDTTYCHRHRRRRCHGVDQSVSTYEQPSRAGRRSGSICA